MLNLDENNHEWLQVATAARDATVIDYGVTTAKIIGVNISTCLKFSLRLFLSTVHLDPLGITRIHKDHPQLTSIDYEYWIRGQLPSIAA